MKVVLAFIGVFCVCFIYNLIYKKYWQKNLKVELSFRDDVSVCGEQNELIEVVTNAKLLPVSILRVRFYVSKHLDFGGEKNVSVSDMSYKSDVFSVMFFQKITRSIAFLCKRRGYYNIDKIEIVSYNLFVKTHLTASCECDANILVLARSAPAKKMDVLYKNIYGDVILKRAFLSDPFEFKGIRAYDASDSIKDINWKASSSSEDLLVNVHGYTSNQQVMVVLNVLGDNDFVEDRVIESCISIAQGLCVRFAKSGVPTGLYTNGKNAVRGGTVFVPPAAGESHIKSIKKALALIDTKNADDIRETVLNIPEFKDSIYVFVSCASKKEVIESAKTLQVNDDVLFVNVYKKGEDRKKASERGIKMYNWEIERLENI